MHMNMNAWRQFPAIPTSANPTKESYQEEHRAKVLSRGSSEVPSESGNNNFKVVIRLRPPLGRETSPHVPFQSAVQVSGDHKVCTAIEYLGAETEDMARQIDMRDNPHVCQYHSFKFDYAYDETSTQAFVYDNTAKPAVISTLEGYNATVLAYGQTGTGKTYTMEGFQFSGQHPDRGIVPRAMEEIFRFIERCPNQKTAFMVRASYLQIYNEVISDLLKTDRSNLQIREDKRKGVFVEGLSEWAVRSPYEIYSLMRKGTNSRVTASTKLNDLSSRSHAVFIIIVEQMTTEDVPTGNPMEDPAKQIKVGKLNLVDLAGSERLSITGATGKRLEECKKINQSLSALGNVIAALTDTKSRSHIPYRDSKLTRLLEDSLGGNCKTTMMAMISPSYMCFSETLSSLKFANRAKNIKNNARINEDVDQRALLRKYEAELKSLRKALEEKNKDVMDKEVLYRLEEDKRKAEEDKAAMIRVLETRSREYMKEKEDKRKLEEKIKLMSSQMLLGGKKIEDTPQFRTALEEKQRIIHQEYEMKLQELEKERQQIEEDKAQVDRYKQLLLKQRDIMIALTARLNERDETIIQLQEELDAYDRIHKETEDKLENRMARVQMLENCLVNGGMQPPPDEEMDERPSEPQMDALRRRYPPYAADCSEGPSDGPLSLLTAEEKIAELMDIIEQQKAVLNQREAEPQPHLSSKLEELQQKEQEVIEQQELLAEAQDRMTMLQRENTALTEDKQKLLSQMESTMLGLAENALRGLKEQKDQYRLYHISQDVQNLQKTIMGVVSMFKRGVKHMPAPSEPKPPMAVLSMNQKVEDEGPRVFRKQVPLTTQEENIRRALRDYYAKK